MKVTKQQFNQIIKEEATNIINEDDRHYSDLAAMYGGGRKKKTEPRRVPRGFTDAKTLPGAVEELEPYWKYTYRTEFGAGSWNMNNGTILVVDSNGSPHVWIPKKDPEAPRQVSGREAMAAVQRAGFVEDRGLPVPYSNF